MTKSPFEIRLSEPGLFDAPVGFQLTDNQVSVIVRSLLKAVEDGRSGLSPKGILALTDWMKGHGAKS